MIPRLGRRLPRTLLTAGIAFVAAVAISGGAVAHAADAGTFDLTVLGTSDLHGNVYNWDYYQDAPYKDSKGNVVGLADVSSVVNAVRSEVGAGHTMLIDDGDNLQGTPLDYYYARQEPITVTGATHPMAAAMNLMDYDATTLGNHEFNYGVPFLNAWINQLDFPALAANAIDVTTGEPAYRPFVIKKLPASDRDHPVRVGILGLTNPGIAIWDKGNVEGKLRFDDMVATAKKWVPIMKRAGADVVIVSAHAGDSGTSSYGPELPIENAAGLIAAQVPGVDAVLFGHSHNDVAQKYVTNQVTGKQVLMTEPYRWGSRVSRMDFTLARDGKNWIVTSAKSTNLNTNVFPGTTTPIVPDPVITAAVKAQHEATVAYVNTVVATCTQTLSAAESRYKDTPILDYINKVQTDTVAAAMVGTPYATLPVLSIAAPFSRTAVFPAGPVRIRDVAGLYVYDNTLEAVVMTGAEVKAYLEYSAKYFNTVAIGATVDPDTLTNAANTPDYNYDVISGLNYQIDISRAVGSRITKLTYPNGSAVADGDQFVVAVNNYRRSGGGNFPGIVKPQVYNAGLDIRQLLIDWATAKGVIDPVDFYQPNWELVRDGVPVF